MGVDMDAVRAALANRPKSAKQSSEGSNNFNWFKIPPDGEIKVRFLPPVNGKGYPGKIVYRHYNMPDKNSFVCLKTWKLECPICKVLDELKYKLDENTLKEYASVATSFHNVLVLQGIDEQTNQPADPTTPYILRSGEFTFYWLLQQIADSEVGDITDPMTGSTVTFKRKRRGGPLDRIVARGATPISNDQTTVDNILTSIPDLDAIWRHPDDKFISEAVMIAKALQLMINERLDDLVGAPKTTTVDAPNLSTNQASASSVSEPVGPSEDSQAPDPEPVKVPTQVQTPSAPNRPADAPECFGNYEATQAAKPDVCMICLKELECQAASGV